MAPLDPTVFIDPLDLSQWTNPPGGLDPGFTQDVIDILGNAGSPSDGFDQFLADTTGIIIALDNVTAEQDGVLDAILAQHQASDPAPLNASVQGYVDTIPAGNSILQSAGLLAVPKPGPLEQVWYPIGTVQPPPPVGAGVQVPGQITVGDPPFGWAYVTTVFLQGSPGVSNTELQGQSAVITSATIFKLFPVLNTVPPGGTAAEPAQDVEFAVYINPVQAGVFTAAIIIHVGAFVPTLRLIAVEVHPKP